MSVTDLSEEMLDKSDIRKRRNILPIGENKTAGQDTKNFRYF